MCAAPDPRPLGLNPAGKQAAPLALSIEWLPVYSVKIGILDEHHKKLFGLVKELHDSMRLQKERAVLASTLNALIDYTQVHFTSEEVLMESFGFSGRRQHKTEHDWLLQIIRELQQKFMSRQVDLTVEMMEVLNVWLANHIVGMDQGYGKFFAERGAR